MDALTHAIEAYVSTLHGPFTDPLALQAIEMVLDYLPASYDCNMEAREQMHYAQCLAGMAFSNALLGIVHSMAHKTGAAFSTGHIPHGCANAIYLPYVIAYNAKEPEAASRYAEIARRMGLEGTSQKALINSLREKINEFNAKLNIPKTIKDFGVNEAEFKEKVAHIAELAVGEHVQAPIHDPLTRQLWRNFSIAHIMAQRSTSEADGTSDFFRAGHPETDDPFFIYHCPDSGSMNKKVL